MQSVNLVILETSIIFFKIIEILNKRKKENVTFVTVLVKICLIMFEIGIILLNILVELRFEVYKDYRQILLKSYFPVSFFWKI